MSILSGENGLNKGFMGQARRPKEADWERATLKEPFSCTLGAL